MNLIGERIKKRRAQFSIEEMFNANEVEANKMMVRVLTATEIILLIAIILCYTDVFVISHDKITPLFASFIEISAIILIGYKVKYNKTWLKFFMMLVYMIVLSRINAALVYNVTLIMVLPVLLSIRYFSQAFTRHVAFLTVILFTLSETAASLWGLGMLDNNAVELSEPVTITFGGGVELSEAIEASGVVSGASHFGNHMLFIFLPKLLVFFLIAYACSEITKRVHDMVIEQSEQATKTVAIESELSIASDIQANMLPRIFPAFPDHDEIDIYASMNPAKEVGGDFYDYFFVDPTHVCIVIADVSGKGVPAALFMVIAKTLIKNHALLGLEPKDIFFKVNNMLCEGNENDMFVTGWLGILDLFDGTMKFVNAGHNPPVYYHDGKADFLRSQPDLVLAVCEEFEYVQHEIKMNPGDKLLLYTDGVTEASNSEKDLYMEDRLLSYFANHVGVEAIDFVKGLKADIDSFVGDAPQFDDITMVALKFTKSTEKNCINSTDKK